MTRCMKFFVQILQIIVSILLIVVILIQHKGAGLGAGFGGGGSGPIVQSKRGVDLFLHRLTIGLGLGFFALAVILIFL